jgi:predicted Zn-dependent protease
VANAGYDPYEASEYWSRLLKKKDKVEIEYLSSHPSSKERFDEMSDHMDELNIIYDNLNLTEEEKKYSHNALVEIPTSS